MKKIDVLAIGDVVVDTFIKLKDAHVHCNLDREGCELCLRFGDKIPYEFAEVIPAVGNSANVAIAISRLGLKSALVANIGKDKNGKDCLKIFKREKVNTKYIKSEKNKNTNFHYVLWYDTERTIMVKHTEFDYQFPKLKISPSYIYLSSLAENSIEYHKQILDFLKNNQSAKLIFQPGTFQIKLGVEKLKEIYARTEIFFSNVEEAQKILKTEDRNILKLAKGIEALGPKLIFITDGEKGAYLYQKDELWFMPVYAPDLQITERTGAGDAFSGAVVSGIALGLTPLESFSWGLIDASYVIRHIGPQKGLLDQKEIKEYLKNAPTHFKAQKIN